MNHKQTVQREFTRQAETFQASATLSATQVTTTVAEALGEAQRVLDVACGPGVLFPSLARPGRSVVGLDLTHRSLQLAQQVEVEGTVHVVEGLAESLPFASASFDAVVLRLALHHFTDPVAVLDALRPVARAGGRLVVLDVLGPEDDEVRALRDSVERIRDPSHTHVLSASTMRDLLARTGFPVISERLWSQERLFSEWAQIMNEPQRMADLERILRAIIRDGDDPTGLNLQVEATDLSFTYDWGLFVSDCA